MYSPQGLALALTLNIYFNHDQTRGGGTLEAMVGYSLGKKKKFQNFYIAQPQNIRVSPAQNFEVSLAH